MNTIGKSAAQVNRVMMMPDFVSSVICQVIAYCTSMEPNIDRNWPVMNKTALRFQLVIEFLFLL